MPRSVISGSRALVGDKLTGIARRSGGHAMDGNKLPEPEPKIITIAVDTSKFVDALWKVRANLLFGWNPDLVELDDELDIMYRGQL